MSHWLGGIGVQAYVPEASLTSLAVAPHHCFRLFLGAEPQNLCKRSPQKQDNEGNDWAQVGPKRQDHIPFSILVLQAMLAAD